MILRIAFTNLFTWAITKQTREFMQSVISSINHCPFLLFYLCDLVIFLNGVVISCLFYAIVSKAFILCSWLKNLQWKADCYILSLSNNFLK